MEPRSEQQTESFLTIFFPEHPSLQPPKPRKPGFGCDNCDKVYKCYSDLRRHVLYVCNKEPRFKCPYCGEKRAERRLVYLHIRYYHIGEREYAIDVDEEAQRPEN